FNYDKPISLGGGGMLVCNPNSLIEQHALDRVRAMQKSCAPAPHAERKELEEFRNWLCVKRSEIGNPPAEPHVALRRLTRKIMSTRPTARRLSASLVPRNERDIVFNLPRSVVSVRAALGLLLLDRYPAILDRRIRNYTFLADQLKDRNVGDMMGPAIHVSPA